MSNYDINSICPIERKELMKSIRAGEPVSVFGLSFGERTHIAALSDKFFVYITTDFVAARLATTQLNELTGGGVVHLPARSDVLSYVVSRDSAISSLRTTSLGAIVSGRARGVVTTAEALAQRCVKRDRWVDAVISLSKGEELDLNAFTGKLARAGYARRNLVEHEGQWSLRGDILDVFPVGEARPVRAEMWGDFVEELKFIDPETQKSDGVTDGVTLYPACEAIMTDSEAAAAARALTAARSKGLAPGESARQERILSETVAKLEGGMRDGSLDFVLPFLPAVTLADYLPRDAVLIYDETKAVLDNLLQCGKEHANRFKTLLSAGEVVKDSVRQFISFEDYRAAYVDFGQLSFARVTTSNLFFDPAKIFNYQCSPMTRYSMNFSELADDLRIWQSRGYRIVLCCRDADGLKAVAQGLDEQGLSVGEASDLEDFWYAKSGAVLIQRELERGFSDHENKAVVIGSGDLFPPKTTRISRVSSKQLFVMPSAGDFVVHYVHGIGKCLGTRRMTTSMGTRDYVEIEYRDGDRLFLPTDQMDLVSKYSGESPRLSKMGGKEFAKVKAKVKEGVKKMAFDLVKLYGAREKGAGKAYAVDDELMKEFIDSFPYRSTEDQLTAFEEIKGDLRTGKIMDRLLVGDVGYGKTEVALRAAFAVILEGRQVAMLAPTTILSEQHFATATKRFAPFGIRIAVLNRFATEQEQTKILRKLAQGEIDFVCGTHRLLSKDVAFNELGLLILDEEQRFGVSDKEKLKTFQNTVSVLTMTATPIPRTLHMSLSGIRDISTLANPPADRLPVQTTVTEYTDALAADSVIREMSRGGQTFIVYNRVESIFHYASQLASVLPNARIMVCHGQMNEAELENNIKRFYEGDADVLVSTTIIENGIDLPAANTLLVVDADKLGLAQLYQLRGRVGRSNRLAYAYFTYTSGKILSEVALKRLETLMEFTEFGSGFKIAMRDLEIRGAGNVLGAEQHGHMEKVGYDLYCKLLGEAVEEVKGTKREAERECEVVMDVDAYLPDGYIDDGDSRMNLYARISAIRTRAERDKLLAELRDVYGEPPKAVVNLVTVGLYKGYGVRLGILKMRIMHTGATLMLEKMQEWAAELLSRKSMDCILRPTENPMIVFEEGNVPVYERVFRFLTDALSVKKSLV